MLFASLRTDFFYIIFCIIKEISLIVHNYFQLLAVGAQLRRQETNIRFYGVERGRNRWDRGLGVRAGRGAKEKQQSPFG